MIKLENAEVLGWEHAIRGMRNPLNSWDKSDSVKCNAETNCDICPANGLQNCFSRRVDRDIVIGENDLGLMHRLRKAGTDHRKFMRMITVYVDITAPLYWWKEFDTYKVGTVANSCSTMHTIHKKEFTIDDFSREHLISEYTFPQDGLCKLPVDYKAQLQQIIDCLNSARELYLQAKKNKDTNAKQFWWQMIQLLPTSYNQKRTVMLNYEVLTNMYHSRKNHKLDEWREFCKWIKTLPYSELIVGEKE